MGNKHLDFVLKYYRHGALDTQSAMRKVMERTGTAVVRPISWGRIAIAAAVIAIMASIGIVYYERNFAMVTLTAENATQTFTLPDSTSVTLRQGSSLAYRKNNPREVELTGTAYFSGNHNVDSHPFTVTNTISMVKVLGTKFVVESPQLATTCVYVAEGKVSFSAADEEQGLILTQGMKAILHNGESLPRRIAAGSINQTAWATGLFHFSNSPLRQVLYDLGDYYKVKLSASDMDKQLTGDMKVGSLEDMIDLIEQTLDVKIDKE